jgi:hypothetical protein
VHTAYSMHLASCFPRPKFFQNIKNTIAAVCLLIKCRRSLTRHFLFNASFLAVPFACSRNNVWLAKISFLYHAIRLFTCNTV